ncbi:hypothetical protein [Spirochaeta cellobiosiphila]|uniref:hypothetical protein n=1 Tax=Spirochaeta cellobiosiphila TaxID=504483 RepID=UPI00048B31E6|nr:hypothetical protein [Spirochaeta cellobiosiphila]
MIVTDIKLWNDKYLVRSNDKIIALGREDFDPVWELALEGRTKIDLGMIFLFAGRIFLFSCDTDSDNFNIFCIDENGNMLWRKQSEYRPRDINSITSFNEELIYLGYNSNSTDHHIIALNFEEGTVIEKARFQLNVQYLHNINDRLYLSGASGLFKAEGPSLEHWQNITDIYIDSVMSHKDGMLFIAESTDAYKLYEFKGTEEGLVSLGEFSLDSSDRGFMEPLFIADKYMVKLAGKKRGVACLTFGPEGELWHRFDGEYTGRQMAGVNNIYLLFYGVDTDFNDKLCLLDLATGEDLADVKYDGMLYGIKAVNNILFVRGTEGLVIYQVKK